MKICIDEVLQWSNGNRAVLEESEFCGCYNCISIFSIEELRKCDFDGYSYEGSDTGVCPYCLSSGTLLPNKSPFPLEREVLEEIGYEVLGEYGEVWYARNHKNRI